MQKILPLFLLLIPAFLSGEEDAFEEDPIDLYIENVIIVDGTGHEAFKGNVAIVGDQIVYVSEEPMSTENVIRTIDGKERYLAPGFIDLHSHGNPRRTPEFENFLAMGVTTITLGQDGSSPEIPQIKSWQREIKDNGIGPNIVMFIGHGTLRNLTGVGTKKIPSGEALDSMKSLLKANLPYTFGLSTGLEYNPGLHSEQEELLELAKVVGESNRMISSHMRNEDDEQLEHSINELLLQGEFCRVHISHIKSVYGKGEQRAHQILKLIKDAKKRGIQVTADIYPYTASYTGIGILFPEWAKTDEQLEKLKEERREELEHYLRERVISRNGPEATLIGTAPYTGKTLADLEEELNMPFEKILIDSIGPQGASAAYFVMDDELQEGLIRDPLIAFCSDGSPTGFHPRGHGTFARVIEEYVLKRKVLGLPEAVRKMTSYPAQILGIADRGVIAENMKADIILFHPAQVKEKAVYSDPLQLSEGFDYVIINGKVVREAGELTGEMPGEFLTP